MRRAEVKLRQIVQVLLPHVGEQGWPDDACVVDDGGDGKLLGDVGRGLFGGAGISQIDFDGMQRRVRPVGHAARQRHDVMAGSIMLPADRGANASAAAGDDGDRAFAHSRLT